MNTKGGAWQTTARTSLWRTAQPRSISATLPPLTSSAPSLSWYIHTTHTHTHTQIHACIHTCMYILYRTLQLVRRWMLWTSSSSCTERCVLCIYIYIHYVIYMFLYRSCDALNELEFVHGEVRVCICYVYI